MRCLTPCLDRCPCDPEALYARCCQTLHQGDTVAISAGQLMRSRYSAYALQREDYLLATWHPDTRPERLDLSAQQPPPTWLGLGVKREQTDGDHAVVEFVARLRLGGGSARRMREVSRFLRVGGRWFYVDGDVVP